MRTYRLEHDEQSALFTWASWHLAKYPDLRLMFAIPNGGHRNLLVAKKMKAEGTKPGVPDIFLPVPRGPHHGLFLEMKAENHRPKREGSSGGLSDVQQQWIADLRAQGYAARVAYGVRDAIEIVETYLRIE